MKAASMTSGRPCVGRWREAFTWCLCALWCAPVAGGNFLLQRQVPATTGTVASTEAAAHVELNIARLKTEAENAIAQQSTVITAVALRKEALAKDAIEQEIPLAAADDTTELSKDVAAQDKELDAALAKSSAEAKEGLEILKDKTAVAVNMSAVRTVRDVEIEAEAGAMNISEHSVQLQAEAQLLAKEATNAANFSQEAAVNSKLWSDQLPKKEAASAVQAALESMTQSKQLRHEYEDVKRIAKLAGNLALTTIKISQQALAQAEVAKKEATLTVEQAAQNALLLNTIRVQTKFASDLSMSVQSAIQKQ